MLEYSRGETDGGGPGRLPRSGWVVVSAGVRLSDNDVWGTISSTAQHLEHTHTHTVTKGRWIQTFTGEQEALTIKKQILKLANCYDLVYKWVLSAGLYFLPPNVSESKQQKQKCRITSVVTPSATNIHRRGNVSKFYSRDILSHLPTSLLTLWSSASNQSWISLGFNF